MESSYFLAALAAEQHPLMTDCALLLGEYLSETGMMSEYYLAEPDGRFQWYNGNHRPWETGCAAAAFYDYVLGMVFNHPKKTITLAPHIAPGWTGYSSEEIPLYDEGTISVTYVYEEAKAVYAVKRRGGIHDLTLIIRLGGFQTELIPVSPRVKRQAPDLLCATVTLPSDGEWQGEFVLADCVEQPT